MGFTIPLNHHIVTLEKKVAEVSQNFLKSLGLSYFQYLRCYHNGSVGLLSNQTKALAEWIDHMPEGPAIFSSYREEHHNKDAYWFLWDEELPAEPVSLVGRVFNTWNGLTLVKRHKHHYDMIAVALPSPIHNAGSFYLNKMPAIEDYIHQFERNNRDMIQIMDKQPLNLPKPYQDSNVDNVPKQRKKGLSHTTRTSVSSAS